MVQHYSTKDFFRRAPNPLLERYFRRHELFAELDIAEMKTTKIEPLFEAWLELPSSQTNSMEADFRQIHGLSSEKGFLALIDEARWHLQSNQTALDALVKKLSSLPNHYHRAMTVFLDYPDYWKGAVRFSHADTLSYWRKRKNLGNEAAALKHKDREQLATEISTYFHLTEGRGNHCLVEVLRRGNLDYFFAWPEDHSQQSIEWVDGEFNNRPHNPAFEVVFVYSQSEGSLDLNYRGSRKALEPLQAMFATVILKLDELPPDPEDVRVYDMDQLGQSDFNFTYEPGSGITSVAVKKLQLTSRIKKGDRVTLEANANQNPEGVYDLLGTISKSLDLNLYDITQVELVASIMEETDKPPKRVTIRITHPNTCSLKYDERDLKLRAMLEASGLEPKAPVQDDGDT
jgi:hypothetical protein